MCQQVLRVQHCFVAQLVLGQALHGLLENFVRGSFRFEQPEDLIELVPEGWSDAVCRHRETKKQKSSGEERVV